MQPNSQRWCSDALHSLLGYTDSALASYLTSLASAQNRASAIQRVVDALMQGDVVPVNTTGNSTNKLAVFQTFATNLVQQVHSERSKSGTGSVQGAARTTNADWVQRAKQYSLEAAAAEPMSNTAKTDTDTLATAVTVSTSSQKDGKKDKKPSKRSYRKTQEEEDSDSSHSSLDQTNISERR